MSFTGLICSTASLNLTRNGKKKKKRYSEFSWWALFGSRFQGPAAIWSPQKTRPTLSWLTSLPPQVLKKGRNPSFSPCAFRGCLSSVVRQNNTSTCEEASSLHITRVWERPAALYETSLLWKRETWLKAPFPQERSGWRADQAYGAWQRNMCRCSYRGITGEGRPLKVGCCQMGGESCASWF